MESILGLIKSLKIWALISLKPHRQFEHRKLILITLCRQINVHPYPNSCCCGGWAGWAGWAACCCAVGWRAKGFLNWVGLKKVLIPLSRGWKNVPEKIKITTIFHILILIFTTVNFLEPSRFLSLSVSFVSAHCPFSVHLSVLLH